ncbi:MAG TPA: nuclear transport factor 2 family protein [Rudaea sp.]|nr:nuclear transport factor 2 family protein [Rudaea sp.]
MLALMAFALAAQAQQPSLPPRYESLAQAEREFASTGGRDGVQKAFLEHFAEDALVLRPFATAAPAWYREHPDGPGKLIWGPQYLAVSAANDLGLSSGPWRYEAERDGKPVVGHGHFLSIWRRDAQGRWRVLFDHGVGNPAPAVAVVATTPLVSLAIPEEKTPSAAVISSRTQALDGVDKALRGRLARDPGKAYAAVATTQTLWLREGSLPAQGNLPPKADGEQACGCGPRVAMTVAASGDLGYTLGGAESARASGVDVRVWRFEGGAWKLLADVTAAVK